MRESTSAEVEAGPAATLPRPSPDWIQADIARALELRRDYYKYTIAVATALLAFTTSFPPKLSLMQGHVAVILVAWPALSIAIICGISIHYIWVWFFISFRDLDNRGLVEQGRVRRARLNACRRVLEVVQIISLIVGVMGTGLFASRNFAHLVETPSKFQLEPPERQN